MIKQIVGHSKDMDTYSVYGHRVSGEMEDAAKKINTELSKWIGDSNLTFHDAPPRESPDSPSDLMPA